MYVNVDVYNGQFNNICKKFLLKIATDVASAVSHEVITAFTAKSYVKYGVIQCCLTP